MKKEAQPNWNKSRPGYKAVHKWIKVNYGSANHCSNCTVPSKRYEWANISGNYLRDISDYKQLCASCHRKMDYTDEQKKNRSLGKKGKPLHKLRTQVVQKDFDGSVINIFDSPVQASIETGIGVGIIYHARNKRLKTAGGFIWTRTV